MSKFFGYAGVVVLALLVLGWLYSKRPTRDAPLISAHQRGEQNAAASIAPLAEDFPKMVARIGRPAFDRGAALYPAFAQHVAADPRCDALDGGGFRDTSTKSEVALFASCDNGYIARASESEVRAWPTR